MSARLPTRLVVSALLRRVHDQGGSAMVLARGDPDGGGILILASERAEKLRFIERGVGPSGETALIQAGPAEIAGDADASDYWQRRRRNDPDLWVIEVDIAAAERFAAETMLSD